MNIPRHLPALLLLLTCLATAQAAAVKDLVVLDFKRMPRNPDGSYERIFEYSFGDWGDKKAVQVRGEGLMIRLLGSKGGVGSNVGPDFRKHSKARIAFIIGNRNRASSCSFSLVDRDGTDCAYDIPLAAHPKGQEISVLIDLPQPSRVEKPGSKPGLDLKKVETWQLKGNFQAEPIEVLFLKVTAVTE
jgi:hypothetical protein